MNVLVIGGAGFIGREICQKLLEREHKPIVFDLAAGQLSSDITFFSGSVENMEQLWEATAAFNIDRIINVAYILGRETQERPFDSCRININGVNNVLEAARIAKIKRVVYTSSVAVYGPQQNYGEKQVTEDDEVHPSFAYGGMKIFNEFMAGLYNRLYDMETVGLRVSNVIGYGRITGSSAYWSGGMITNAALGKPFSVDVRKDEKVNVIYVKDAAEQCVRLCLAEGVNHPLYLSGGDITSIEGFINLIKQYLPQAEIEAPVMGGKSITTIPYLIDSSKIETEFGYKRPPLADRILEFINIARYNAQMPLIKA